MILRVLRVGAVLVGAGVLATSVWMIDVARNRELSPGLYNLEQAELSFDTSVYHGLDVQLADEPGLRTWLVETRERWRARPIVPFGLDAWNP